MSIKTIVGAAVLVAIATEAGWVARSVAAPPEAAQRGAALSVASDAAGVTGGGTTLRSVSARFPDSDRTFPGGASADAINSDCLKCHSAAMVLTQPRLSRVTWQAVVQKMRNIYQAPFPAKDIPAIVDYLVALSESLTAPPPQLPTTSR